MYSYYVINIDQYNIFDTVKIKMGQRCELSNYTTICIYIHIFPPSVYILYAYSRHKCFELHRIVILYVCKICLIIETLAVSIWTLNLSHYGDLKQVD